MCNKNHRLCCKETKKIQLLSAKLSSATEALIKLSVIALNKIR